MGKRKVKKGEGLYEAVTNSKKSVLQGKKHLKAERPEIGLGRVRIAGAALGEL